MVIILIGFLNRPPASKPYSNAIGITMKIWFDTITGTHIQFWERITIV